MAELRQDTRSEADERTLDDVVTLTSELIRFDTTNRGAGDCAERPAAEYVAERLAEAGYEPVVLESAPGRANVVARIAGTEPERGALLVHGHLDVVPAQAADWRVPPFSGEVTDGVVWGRGAVDMKNADAMALAVVRGWARQGRRPRRDIVLAFTADEEDTAAYGSGFLVAKHAELFEGCTEGISESGAYTFHAAPDVRVYPIATGERGTAWLRLTARGTAGHGAKHHPDNAVTKLATVIARIGAHRWPVRTTETTRAALRGIGAALGVAVPDLDALPEPEREAAVASLMEAFGPAATLVRSTLHNSSNPTMLDAGYKVNVIPGTATAYVDGRVLPGHLAEFEATIAELVGDGSPGTTCTGRCRLRHRPTRRWSG
jgi:acetylornithine deacetylase/succinyl-diaminopimelate desuccinylase-like protein